MVLHQLSHLFWWRLPLCLCPEILNASVDCVRIHLWTALETTSCQEWRHNCSVQSAQSFHYVKTVATTSGSAPGTHCTCSPSIAVSHVRQSVLNWTDSFDSQAGKLLPAGAHVFSDRWCQLSLGPSAPDEPACLFGNVAVSSEGTRVGRTHLLPADRVRWEWCKWHCLHKRAHEQGRSKCSLRGQAGCSSSQSVVCC